MSILVNANTKLVVQGITGKEGAFHTQQMVSYGTRIVAGVTHSKGGQKDENGIPIFNTVQDAKKETGANTSIVFVPHFSQPELSSPHTSKLLTIDDTPIPIGSIINSIMFILSIISNINYF